MIKTFLRSFYAKLSLLFLVLLMVMAVVHMAITFRMAERRQIEVDQRVNEKLAADIAREIEPYIEEEIDLREIEPLIHYMMVMNPAVEIYLLDSTGKILAFYAEPGKLVKKDRVDLAPIITFLGEYRRLPVYGDDPRHPQQKKHFSAARLRLGQNEPGYLYVVLWSSRYDLAATMLRERYLLSILGSSTLISLPIVGLIGLMLFAYVTRRLQKLTRTVRAFGKEGHTARAEIGSKDEIGELEASFNQMAGTIAANLERLRKADRLRRDLIAGISHDLRTPLSSIRGYIETLSIKDDSLSDVQRRRYLDILMRNTTVLSQLVDELFELSKLESNQVRPRPERFSLSELTQDVVMKMAPEAENLKVRLESESPGRLYFVVADIGMIERVLTNLVENALRHAPEGGYVRVALSEAGAGVRVSVHDTGAGIPTEDLPRVFDRFYVGPSGQSRPKAGSGLGLAISRKIVELHAGTIEVESRVGEGSTFRFCIPLAV